VDGLGHEVPDTRTAVYLDRHKPDCGVYDMRTGDMSWCSGSVCLSRCWCVDGLGHEVPDTRTAVYLDKSPTVVCMI